MIYFTTAGGGGAVIVLEPGEIERMLRSQPLTSPDGNVMIVYTPDMPWFEGEFKAMLTRTGGEVDEKMFELALKMGRFKEKVMR
jgi:hypothetical protein